MTVVSERYLATDPPGALRGPLRGASVLTGSCMIVRTFQEYDAFLPHPDQKTKEKQERKGLCSHDDEYKQGHLYDPSMPVQEVRAQLDRVRGHLVWMSMDFLCEETMAEKGLAVNQFTESIYT